MTMVPLTRRPGGIQAFKLVIAAGDHREPDPRAHEGYEWLYVLDGRLRLVLGDHDLVLTAGEAAEFDTHVPHWFGAAGPGAVEFLSLFGKQGERAHLRARPAGAGVLTRLRNRARDTARAGVRPHGGPHVAGVARPIAEARGEDSSSSAADGALSAQRAARVAQRAGAPVRRRRDPALAEQPARPLDEDLGPVPAPDGS